MPFSSIILCPLSLQSDPTVTLPRMCSSVGLSLTLPLPCDVPCRLQLVGNHGNSNVGQRCRLQLYCYPSDKQLSKREVSKATARRKSEDHLLVEQAHCKVFQIWAYHERKRYPSSLTVSLSPYKMEGVSEEREGTLRSMLPVQPVSSMHMVCVCVCVLMCACVRACVLMCACIRVCVKISPNYSVNLTRKIRTSYSKHVRHVALPPSTCLWWISTPISTICLRRSSYSSISTISAYFTHHCGFFHLCYLFHFHSTTLCGVLMDLQR